MRSLLLPPPGTTFEYSANSAPPAVSPDGRHIAFGAREADGSMRLWIRDLDAPEAYVVPGGDGALFPFWSPDSRRVGFFARGALKLVDASPSPQPPKVLVTDILEPRGGTWAPDGTILFSPGNLGPLKKVSDSGGAPPVTLPLVGDEKSHRWPRFLPDGRHFLVEIRKPGTVGGPLARSTYVASLDSAEKRQILTDDTSPAYAPPGYLTFVRATSLMAVPFDPKSLTMKGEPTALVTNVEGLVAPGSPSFSVSENLLVVASAAHPRRLIWLDRSGREVGAVGSPGQFFNCSITPDGRTAVATVAQHPLPPDVWVFDTSAGGGGIRVTRDAVAQVNSIISPDGRRIFCSAYSRGPWDLWETTPRGGTDLKVFLESETSKTANDISPDGRYLLYREFNPGTLGDLKVVGLSGDRTPRTYIATADDETNGDFSPDGLWVAYVSDESGRKEVYAASFPEPTRRVRVTSDGGAQPRWSHDGKELFYVRAGQLVAVPVARTAGGLTFGPGKTLFSLPLYIQGDPGFDLVTRYDVAPDGRFLALVRAGDQAPKPLTLVLNWSETLKPK